MKAWAIQNSTPIVGVLLTLVGIYWAVGKVDDHIATRNAELRGQIKADIGEAQIAIKDAVDKAEKALKEAKEAEGKTDSNANSGKANADAKAKKKLTEMVNDWNGAAP